MAMEALDGSSVRVAADVVGHVGGGFGAEVAQVTGDGTGVGVFAGHVPIHVKLDECAILAELACKLAVMAVSAGDVISEGSPCLGRVVA